MAKKDDKPAEYTTDTAHPGVEEQILYPTKVVDAERAAAYAAGKVDTLEPGEDE